MTPPRKTLPPGSRFGYQTPPPSDLIGTFRRKNDQVRKNGLRLHIFYVAGLDRGGVRNTNELIGKYQLGAGLVSKLF